MTKQFLILVLLMVPVLAFAEERAQFQHDYIDREAQLELNAKAIDNAELQLDNIDRKEVKGEKSGGPCTAVLCLSEFKNSMGKGCDKSIKTYFKIRKKKHHHFSASRTYRARWKWLNKCKDADKSDKYFVQNLYGFLPRKPHR